VSLGCMKYTSQYQTEFIYEASLEMSLWAMVYVVCLSEVCY